MVGILVGFLMILGEVSCERGEMVIGGGGKPWAEVCQRWIGLDDTTYPGAIQPKELKPWENILRSPKAGKEELKNIFGYEWCLWKTRDRMKVEGKELGWNPRMWKGGRVYAPSVRREIGGPGKGHPALIDGDETTAIEFRIYLPYIEFLKRPLGFGWYSPVETNFWTIDLGIPVPVNRIRFFPPQRGVDPFGRLYREDFPIAYEVSVTDKPYSWLLFGKEGGLRRSLDHIVERIFTNTESIIDVRFPTESVRFIRLAFDLAPQTYTLAEVEVYGEGFPPSTRYISKVIDFGKPVTFGRVFYKFTKLRRTSEGELVEDPTAPVRLVLQTKSGLDDQPLAYHIISDLWEEVEVTKEEYDRAGTVGAGGKGMRLGFPGTQGSVTEDEENWDAWSSPYESSGEQIRSSDGRRYFQFKFKIESEDVFATGRLDSLAFEYSPLLAKEVVGEVSLLDEPNPPGGVAEVPAGVDTVFAYDIKAEFDSPDQRGFDGLRLNIPSGGKFLRFEMGEPLSCVEPDSVEEGGDYIKVFFPSHRVTGQDNRPIRVVFKARILSSGTYFTGEVFDTGSDNLPQSINSGDANGDVSTDGLRVFCSGVLLRVLSSVDVFPEVVSPNGDGCNDYAEVRFDVLGVEKVEVFVGVYDVFGGEVRELVRGVMGAGMYVERWDCRGEGGALVEPGVYLLRVRVRADVGDFGEVRRVLVVY